MKELKTKRYTFRMTAKEAELLEEAAKKFGCKTSHLARIAVSAVSQAANEKAAA